MRAEDEAAYVAYVEETGLREYRATAGNHAAHMLTRRVGDLVEIVTFSLWDSLDAIRGFAGDDLERAVFYPEDDRYLVERDLTVRHFEVRP